MSSSLVRSFMIEGAEDMPENMYVTDSADFKHLCEQGFTAEEAMKLIYMKEHFAEQLEYRELLEEQHRLAFARWLVEHDRISEGKQ